jgi:hypothetical protein
MLENPFYVLDLRPDCTRIEVERSGQKLLAMLELGLSAAKTYKTPLGEMERTQEKVRLAMAELRDPLRRLDHEVWARIEPTTPVTPPRPSAAKAEPWVGARRLGGWVR